MTSQKSKKGRWTVGFLLPLVVIVMALFTTGCATSQKPPAPQKTMSLTIDSVPSGAEVYSHSNGEQGVLIGTTPLEIKVGAYVDYGGMNYNVWFYSPDDCVTAEKSDSTAGQEYALYLSCVLLKEGYLPKHVLNRAFTTCSTQFGIDFDDEEVELDFTLEPVNK